MKIYIAIFACLCAFAIHTNGQDKPSEPAAAPAKPSFEFRLYELALLTQICSLQPANAKCENRNISRETSELLVEIAKEKDGAKILIQNAMEKGNLATLQMIQIAQNQRIIELLELLLQKKQ